MAPASRRISASFRPSLSRGGCVRQLGFASNLPFLYASGMRTTLDIPEETLEEARRAANLRTKRETVVAGLEELIRKARREELRALPGRIRIDVDIARSRDRRRS